MPKYVLILRHPLPSAEAQTLVSRIKDIGAEYHKVSEEFWALRSAKSSRQISEQLFPRNETTKTTDHVVLRCDAYWGFHDRELWEFLDKKEI